MPVTYCQLCKSGTLEKVLDLGLHPLADTFLATQAAARGLELYPLQVLLCMQCGHAMSAVVVPKEKRYQATDYSYDSANSRASVEHFEKMAEDVLNRFAVSAKDLVVDIGGNVGTLLKAFSVKTGARVLNIEPAHNIAVIAQKDGIETIQDFWNETSSARVARDGGAKLILSTNSFNHIDELDSFMQNIKDSLAPDGVFVVEVPYLLTLVEHNAFDTVYLEHVSYFAVKPLAAYLKKFGLNIMDATRNDYMGGSLRLFIGLGQRGTSVDEHIAREEAQHLFDPELYQAFRARVEQFRLSLMAQLSEVKRGGGTIIGIGAATKGNTLLNYCGIDTDMIEFITDASKLKIGKFTPGSGIPILSDSDIPKGPAHALILPWNIAGFLQGKLGYRYPHLAFIVPHMSS